MLKLLEEEIKEGFSKWRDKPPLGTRRTSVKTPALPIRSTDSTRFQSKPQQSFVQIQTNQLQSHREMQVNHDASNSEQE